MNTTPTTAATIRTRSSHPFALVAVDRAPSTVADGRIVPGDIVGASIVGYAASDSDKVRRRAANMARPGRFVYVRPIVDGRVDAAVRETS
jgi:hypothetical protein